MNLTINSYFNLFFELIIRQYSLRLMLKIVARQEWMFV